MSRFEAEVEVSDFDTMSLILEHLGYRPYMAYEKYRTTYELDSAEIVLDEMPFGNFVEIEGEAATIERIITRLNLQDAERFGRSYTGLFELVKRNLDLEFRDLTFENFEDIQVPVSALQGGKA
jgi:adenylate cyclase class 2